MSETEIVWTKCGKCDRPIIEHTSVTWTVESGGLACPNPKPAEVVPLRPRGETK